MQQKMKKAIAFLLAALTLLTAMCAFADDAPDGTEPLDLGGTLWTESEPDESARGGTTLSAVNATIRFLGENGRPAGDEYEQFSFGEDYVNPATGMVCEGGKITARISAPEAKKDEIDHWVINGTAYYFSSKVWFITVYDLDFDAEFEVVYKNAEAVTDRVLNEESERVVESVKAQMQFVDEKRQPAGKRFNRFDFASDYVSCAADETMSGGTFSGRVEALIPEGKAVDYWLIRGVEVHFNIAPRCITVEGLNRSTTFEAVFRSAN